MRIEDVLELFCDGLEILILEASSALKILCRVFGVEGHIEPLGMQRDVGLGYIPCRKSFGRVKHFFEPSKMFERWLHLRLLEDVVSTGLKIDILPVSRLFLLHCLLKGELESLLEVLSGSASLRSWCQDCYIDGLRKVLVERLIPGSPVLALEHIFELHNGVDPGEVTFSDHLLNSGIVLSMVNLMPYLPLSLWISTQLLLWGLLLCNF